MRRSPIEMSAGELRVAGTSLSLDARRRAECAFVSHAHGDHLGRHDRAIATPATLALMSYRLGVARRRPTEALPARYRAPFGLGELTLELFPAGHVLGSAQLRVSRDGGPVLGYTGDLCLEPTHAAERAEVVPCDVLVTESTFGHPRYAFPPKEEILAGVRKFVEDTLTDGVTPVLLGYALGKAQEIEKWLCDQGFAVRAHPAVHAINRIYAEHGVDLAGARPIGAEPVGRDEVVVAPPHLAWSQALKSVRRRRTAVLTGWALDGGRRFRGVDAAFPLSDHADFPSLVRYAKETGASRVFTVHGFEEELAAALRRQGLRAEPLRETRQLELL